MKRMTITFLAAVCILSLAGCGSQAPSLDEVERAIEEGTVTMEDALEKGWVTQEWVDSYMEKNTVPAADKISAHAVSDFTSTTLSGEEFTRDDIGDVTFFAFVDPASKEAEAYYEGLVSAYEGIVENGGEVLVCTKSEENTEMFSDAPFPVIVYNDSLKEAVQNHTEMIEGNPTIGSWYMNGAFFSSWISSIDQEKMVESAKAFAEMQQDMREEETGSMAVMG
ncbi:MAG TPA: hypothetical protein H9671_04645 [Firmicutes bacterium]|nr:hypothetical protein [Bacillota bacterium]